MELEVLVLLLNVRFSELLCIFPLIHRLHWIRVPSDVSERSNRTRNILRVELLHFRRTNVNTLLVAMAPIVRDVADVKLSLPDCGLVFQVAIVIRSAVRRSGYVAHLVHERLRRSRGHVRLRLNVRWQFVLWLQRVRVSDELLLHALIVNICTCKGKVRLGERFSCWTRLLRPLLFLHI